MLAALEAEAEIVANLRHRGSPRLPIELSSTFASPGEPGRRPTILFLHGKGGNSSEWQPDALRALALGYNVLLPDLRAHGKSGGTIFTLGLLEKDDLALTLEAARESFGVDPDRIGIHACSAGSSVALEFAAGRSGIRALWLESPFAEPREMARHYLSRATKVPAPLLALTTHWAISRAVARVRRELGVGPSAGGPRAARSGGRRRPRHGADPARSRRGRPARAAALHAAAGRGPASAKRRLERRRRRPLPSRERARGGGEAGLRAEVGGVLQDLSAGVGPVRSKR